MDAPGTDETHAILPNHGAIRPSRKIPRFWSGRRGSRYTAALSLLFRLQKTIFPVLIDLIPCFDF